MLGRKRRGLKKNAPRNVDLDLLLVGDMIIQSTPLTLPHPRLHLRAFVLRPLLDLAPDIRIPGQGPASAFLDIGRGPEDRTGRGRRAITPASSMSVAPRSTACDVLHGRTTT